MKTLFPLFVAALATGLAARADDKPVDFVRDIQPILKDNCYKCHGPEKKKGGLQLHNKAAAFAGGDNGVVVVPGKPDKSPLYQLLIAENEDDRMPQNADPLPKDKIELIRFWIAQGAPWPDGADSAAR